MQLPADVHDSVCTPALSPELAGTKFVAALQTPTVAAPAIGEATKSIMPDNSKLTTATTGVNFFTFLILLIK